MAFYLALLNELKINVAVTSACQGLEMTFFDDAMGLPQPVCLTLSSH